MRRLILGAIGTAAAVVAMTPMMASAATTTHVLTITKVGGTNVAVGAKLSASIKSGTKAVFSEGTEGSASCTKSSVADATGDLTVAYAPVEDTSVTGDPHVFVN